MMEHRVCFVVFILSLLSIIHLKGSCDSTEEEEARLACSQNANCSSCIQTSRCVWCSQEMITVNDTLPVRCVLFNASLPAEAWCSTGQVINPQAEIQIEKNKSLGKFGDELVQIKPQSVKLKLRVGEPFDLAFQYKQAEDYPVDLYYVMDLSASMSDDKDKLSVLGNKLAEVMGNITSNFRLGFGSFVDKVEMPFVSTVPARLKNPCDTSKPQKCVAPYSFKNHLALSIETKKFSEMVRKASVSGNLDSPEGGFDALMQSMVCEKEIGWRQKARHLLVFSTDASFHLAGDGKLAGIIRPNDGQCHMTNGMYDKSASLEYDYPSIAQLDQKAKEKNMNIIFAVASKHELYKALAERIAGASYGALDKDSANVVGLVRNQYDKLVDGVTISNSNNEFVEIRYFSSCLNKSESLKETKKCDGLRINTTVDFIAEIRVLKCPSDPADRIQFLEIKPLALNESLVIELEIVCDCSCEKPGGEGYKNSTPECNGGDSKCGVCACKEGRVGRQCECKGDQYNLVEDQSACKGPNNSSLVCSGMGSCKCGLCNCKKRKNPSEVIYGPLCECNNYSCKRKSGGEVCSGSLQGECRCGRCECKPGWIGEACECRNYNNSCIAKDSKDICSNKGDCVCGACKCHDQTHRGKYCEECTTCPGRRCEELRFCVGCSLSKQISEECVKCSTKNHKITLVDKLTDDDIKADEDECRSPDDAGCTFIFKYKYDDETMEFKIEALTKKDCGTPLNLFGEIFVDIVKGLVLVNTLREDLKKLVEGLIFGITGSTVFLGLLLLIIWKLITSIHDRREFVKFEKERAMSKWDRGDNPLYKPSTSTFSNPTFGNN